MLAYCDGGCRGNGTDNAKTYGSFRCGEEYVGRTWHNYKTNNSAEYATLIALLRFIKEKNYRGVEIHMDSALVVNQIAHGWKVRAPNLKGLHAEASRLIRETGAVLVQVPRDEIFAVLGH